MNRAFTSLLDEKIDQFKYSFNSTTRRVFLDSNTGSLIHPGEFGMYRERIIREFLRLAIPSRLDIGTGFLINCFDEISTQIDVVIFDQNAIPRIQSNENQIFYPVEGVCCIGEVKSVLNKSQLKEAIQKMATSKSVCDKLSSTIPLYRDKALLGKEFNRSQNIYDQIFSFLICEKFDFNTDTIVDEIDQWYDPMINKNNKHNLILSIEDGLLMYYDNNSKSWMYPLSYRGVVKNRFIKYSGSDNAHIKLFCNYLNIATSSTTILYPEMSKYMNLTSVDITIDQR